MGTISMLVLIAASVAGYSIARVDAVQQSLRIEYVQKVDYREDLGRIENALISLNNKMDKMNKSLSE